MTRGSPGYSGPRVTRNRKFYEVACGDDAMRLVQAVGRELPILVSRVHPPLIERFLEKIVVTPHGIEWDGALSIHGYGKFSVYGRLAGAHRLAYALWVGPIPEGLELDHTCHNDDKDCLGGKVCPHHRCVTPDHLEPVPHVINSRRGRSPERMRTNNPGGQIEAARTHCPQKHEYTPENTWTSRSGSRHCRTCQSEQARERRRNAPRKERPKPECGTLSAYSAHYARGERPCDACRAAQNVYKRLWLARKRQADSEDAA